MQNLGYLIMGVTAFLIVVALLIMLRCFTKKYKFAQNLYKSLEQKILFSTILTYYTKSFLKTYLASLLGIKSFLRGDTKSTSAFGMALVISLIYTISPLAILIFLKRRHKLLSSIKFRTRYGSLYPGTATSNIFKYSWNVIFIFRRLQYSIVIVLLPQYPAFQLMSQIFISYLCMFHIAKYKPFEESSDNLTELLNELTCLLVFCFLTPYVQGSSDPDTLFLLGFFIIGLILINVMVNFSLFFKMNGQVLYRKLLRQIHMCKQRKQQKALANQQLIDSLQYDGKQESQMNSTSKPFNETTLSHTNVEGISENSQVSLYSENLDYSISEVYGPSSDVFDKSRKQPKSKKQKERIKQLKEKEQKKKQAVDMMFLNLKLKRELQNKTFMTRDQHVEHNQIKDLSKFNTEEYSFTRFANKTSTSPVKAVSLMQRYLRGI